MAAYYASKSFVLSFSRGLARELAGTGVSVTALCPGPTSTSLEERSGATHTPLYRWVPPMSARAVAQSAYGGLKRGRPVVVPGLLAKVLAFAGELPLRRAAVEVNRLLLTPLRRETAVSGR